MNTPTAAAAAEALRISVGIAQNTGRNELAAIEAMERNAMVRAMELGWLIRPSKPAVAITSTTAQCERLSPAAPTFT